MNLGTRSGKSQRPVRAIWCHNKVSRRLSQAFRDGVSVVMDTVGESMREKSVTAELYSPARVVKLGTSETELT